MGGALAFTGPGNGYAGRDAAGVVTIGYGWISLTEGLGHAYDHRWELGLDHDLDLNLGHKELEKALLAEVYETLRNQETHFFKKARVDWLRGGDLNTRFFHATVIRH